MLAGTVLYSYDADGFLTQLERWSGAGRRAEPGKLYLRATRSYQRLDGGARVLETTRPSSGYHRTAEFRFFVRTANDAGTSDAGTSDAGASDAGASDAGASDAGAPSWQPSAGLAQPIALGVSDKPKICLCPQDNESLCVLASRPFCIADSPRVALMMGGPDVQSCLACGERVEVDVNLRGPASFDRKEVWHAMPSGVRFEVDYGHAKGTSVGSYHFDAARSVFVTRDGSRPEQMQKVLPWGRAYCAANQHVDCSYDALGNLLEVTNRGRKTGRVSARTVYSYRCREELSR
jgi:hypothetical protein